MLMTHLNVLSSAISMHFEREGTQAKCLATVILTPARPARPEPRRLSVTRPKRAAGVCVLLQVVQLLVGGADRQGGQWAQVPTCAPAVTGTSDTIATSLCPRAVWRGVSVSPLHRGF